MRDTIFERCGGFGAISRIDSDFYDRAADSPLLSPYAEGLLDDSNLLERGEFEVKGFGTQKLFLPDSGRG